MTGLTTKSVEKPWGRDNLPAPFDAGGRNGAPDGKRIGEIWFEPPAELSSLLVKYIFTSENLSVQVHPNDDQAKAAGGTAGKEECWLVIDAEPGAALGVGFARSLDHAALRAAALDGAIEDLLVWHPVRRGDFFYIPAGTVHAIGAGVSLIEIQQNSDITYRLYDYGRPRELHLDQGIAVARGEPHDPALRTHLPDTGTVELARGRYFTAHRLQGQPGADLLSEYDRPMLAIPLSGAIGVRGETVEPGGCAYAATIADIAFAADGMAVIVHPNT